MNTQSAPLFPLGTHIEHREVIATVDGLNIMGYVLTGKAVREEFDQEWLVYIDCHASDESEVNQDDCPAETMRDALDMLHRFRDDKELHKSFTAGENRDFLR